LPVFKRDIIATLRPDRNVGKLLRSGVALVGRWLHGGLISVGVFPPVSDTKGFSIHGLTPRILQREIGEHLGLHPGYISNIVLKFRKV
jgi:hypothetical protein